MRKSTKTVAGAAALATLLAGAGYALAQNTQTPTSPATQSTTPTQTPNAPATPSTDPAATQVTPGAQTNSPSPAAANPGMPTSPAMPSDSNSTQQAPMDSNRATPSDGSTPAPRADRN